MPITITSIAEGHTTNGAGPNVVSGSMTFPSGGYVCVVARRLQGSMQANTCADTLGNTYTRVLDFDDTTSNFLELVVYIAPITNAGTGTLQLSWADFAVMNLLAWTFTGQKTTSPFTTGEVRYAAQGGASGTDSQTTGVIPATGSLAQVPGTLFGVGWAVNNDGAPTEGTGFTSEGTSWASQSPSGTAPLLRLESRRLTANTATAATFTPPEFRALQTVGIFFAEEAAPSITLTDVDGDEVITSTQTGVVATGTGLSGATLSIIQGSVNKPQAVTGTTAVSVTFNVSFDS